MLHSWDWKEQAACKHNAITFYPSNLTPQRMLEARNICNRCPVFEECERFAEENHERYGIWAGVDYSATERRRVKEATQGYYKKKRD